MPGTGEKACPPPAVERPDGTDGATSPRATSGGGGAAAA